MTPNLLWRPIIIEPPVPDTPIRVLEQTQDYIVFDKPHGITVHPNELCFFNTALEILRRDHDIPHYMHGTYDGSH